MNCFFVSLSRDLINFSSIYHQVRDYDKARDAPVKPASVAMPPLLREFVARSRAQRGETTNDEDFHLPAAKIYRGDVNVDSDAVASDDMAKYLTDEFATHKDFGMELLPEDWSLNTRPNRWVGKKLWHGYTEGQWEWDIQKEKDEEYDRLVQKSRDLSLREEA